MKAILHDFRQTVALEEPGQSANLHKAPTKWVGMSGVYALRSYNFTDPSTNNTEIVKDLISFTTFNMNPMQFTVALNK